MKKLFISFSLLALVLLISSCGDILNPESYTHTSKIKYHSVLKDQEHSVIMPLKVGNMWVYKVTELNGDGSVKAITYDTTLVTKDTLINKEKWFITVNSQLKDRLGPLLLTNTDVGLFSNEDCSCKTLKAEYPVRYHKYLLQLDELPLQIRIYDEHGELNDQPTTFASAFIWVDVEILSAYNSYYGIFKTFKYNTWCDISYINKESKKIKLLPNGQYTEYYVPDLGLVHKEFFNILSDSTQSLAKIWELTFTNVKI
jgi:hypothetical protein